MIYAQAWFIKKDELIDIDTVMGSKPKNLTEAELQIDASIICHIALTLADGRAQGIVSVKLQTLIKQLQSNQSLTLNNKTTGFNFGKWASGGSERVFRKLSLLKRITSDMGNQQQEQYCEILEKKLCGLVRAAHQSPKTIKMYKSQLHRRLKIQMSIYSEQLNNDLLPECLSLYFLRKIEQMVDEQTYKYEELSENMIQGLLLEQQTYLLRHLGHKLSQQKINILSKQMTNFSEYLQHEFQIQNKKDSNKFLKDYILKMNSHLQQPVVFLLWFNLIDKIYDKGLATVSSCFTVDDILNFQTCFYGCMQAIFHKTSTIDFTTLSLQFHLFMLAHSSYSALRLNQKLNQHLICKYTPIRINQEKLDKLIEGRDTRLFVQFIVQPHETAKIVLYHYLAKSGIVITAAMKNHARLRYIRQNGPKLHKNINDPLNFMLVNEKYWADQYCNEVLQLSLWLTLDIFLKSIQAISSQTKQNDSEFVDYCRKQMLVIIIFMMSLSRPTDFLSYYPIEQDLLKDLITIPIFPVLLLRNTYFFEKIEAKTIQTSQFGNCPEDWILPWSSIVTSPKSLMNYIHFDQGYVVAVRILRRKPDFIDSSLAQMLVSAIANTLQRIGVNINIDCSELVNRQALVQLSLDNKKLLLEILKRCSFCSFERTSLAAQKLLKYFEEL